MQFNDPSNNIDYEEHSLYKEHTSIYQSSVGLKRRETGESSGLYLILVTFAEVTMGVNGWVMNCMSLLCRTKGKCAQAEQRTGKQGTLHFAAVCQPGDILYFWQLHRRDEEIYGDSFWGRCRVCTQQAADKFNCALADLGHVLIRESHSVGQERSPDLNRQFNRDATMSRSLSRMNRLVTGKWQRRLEQM